MNYTFISFIFENCTRKILYGLIVVTFLLPSPCAGRSAFNSSNAPFRQVIIWGHKLHSHTHSYIHHCFHKTFTYLNYKTHWLSNDDDLSDFDFSNSLFITEWQVDEKMPLRDDCWYAVHNSDVSPRKDRYDSLKEQGRFFQFRVYTNDCKSMNILKINDYVYWDREKVTLFMPWATDLLPFEIDVVKQQMPYQRSNTIYFIGTIGGGAGGNINEMRPFIQACHDNATPFKQIVNCDMEYNMYYNRISFVAPAIQGTWQLEVGYIPCRIFKNISYGNVGATNSETVYDLFNKKIVYNSDTYALFADAQQRAETITLEEMFEIMDFVKENHTFLNRVDHIREAFELIKK